MSSGGRLDAPGGRQAARREKEIGPRESLLARINALSAGIGDGAIMKKLSVIGRQPGA